MALTVEELEAQQVGMIVRDNEGMTYQRFPEGDWVSAIGRSLWSSELVVQEVEEVGVRSW